MRKRDLVDRIKEKAKNNRLTRDAYTKLKIRVKDSGFSAKQISIIDPIPEEIPNSRINIVLPTLRASMVFGGISTALNAFFILSEGYDRRIIVTGDEGYDSALTYKIKGFSCQNHSNQVHFLGDNKKLTVRKNDIFLVTSWSTAYTIIPVYKWQRKFYKNEMLRLIYFIQDFEPGFVPWSSEYLYADSTYRICPERMIAIFNSEELHIYFRDNGYKFSQEFYFCPNINQKLKQFLENNKLLPERQKNIVVYGRISSARNAFGLLIDSLAYWSENYNKAKEWCVISLGEEHPDIHLANNIVRSKGKLSLEEYGREMLTAYVGVSLMASPHPSYPPLEMSTFGIKTITNKFANKDLSYFNQNIVSVADIRPENIGGVLAGICDEYYLGKINPIIKDGNYWEGEDFVRVLTCVRNLISKMVK